MRQSPLTFLFLLPLQLLALFPSVFASYILTTLRPVENKTIIPGFSSRRPNFSSDHARLPWLRWPAMPWSVALWSGYVMFWWAKPESHAQEKRVSSTSRENHPGGLDSPSRKPKRIHSIPFFLYPTIYWMSSHVPVTGWYIKHKIHRAIWQYISEADSVIQAKTWRVSRCWLGEGQGRKEWGGRDGSPSRGNSGTKPGDKREQGSLNEL